MLLRIVIIWAVAILCAWLVRTVVPPLPFGFAVVKNQVATATVGDSNRIISWLCILVAIVLSIRPVVRLFMQDFFPPHP